MDTRAADTLGNQIANTVNNGQIPEALAMLSPRLTQRTPFRLLDRIGARIGQGPLPETNEFLAKVAHGKAMGAWPLIGSALAAQLTQDFESALEGCHAFIVSADVWYAADTLAERVPGVALVTDFKRALSILDKWRTDPDRWVRKSVGVAIHLWAKRSRGEDLYLPKVRKLLAFLSPMFSEQDLDSVKGIGWALKTMGRYYPNVVTPWLVGQVTRPREYRALMLRKAVTFLSTTERNRVHRAALR